MNCKKCNVEISEDTRFCGGCGTKVEEITTVAQETQESAVIATEVEEVEVEEVEEVEVEEVEEVEVKEAETVEAEVPSFSVNDILDDERKEAAKVMAKEAAETAKVVAKEATEVAKDMTEKMKKLPPKKLAVLGAAVIVLLLACLSMFGKETININDYVTIEFTGYEEAGRMHIDFDKYALIDDIVLNTKNMSGSNYDYIHSVVWDIEFDYDEDEYRNLDNGDKVEIEIEYNEDMAKKLDVKLKESDIKVTVEGLEEVEKLNPFDYITVEFTGTSPSVKATIKYDIESNSRMSSVRGELSETIGIAQGDRVVVTIPNGEASDTRINGYILTETEKTFTCEDVDRYVSKVEDINEKYTDKFEEMASDELEAYFVNNNLGYKELKYEGMYILMAKESSWRMSYVYVVMSATISTSDEEASTKLYFPMEMSNVIVTAEGEYIYDNSISLPAKESGVKLGWSSVVGYSDKDYMYQKIITANKNNYEWDATKSLIAD